MPKDWNLTLEGDRLTISRAGDIWILAENRINAPLSHETAAQTDARVRERGARGRCAILFRVEPRWSAARWAETRQKNAAIWRTIEALPEKYHITVLYDASLSRKGTPTYIARGGDDAERIAACMRESEALQKTLLPLPVHDSERYSLFAVSREGADDEMHRVSPAAASRELFQVEALLQTACPLPAR